MSESDLDKRFHEAAEKIKVFKPKKDPSDDEKLEVYALYKQATQVREPAYTPRTSPFPLLLSPMMNNAYMIIGR